VCARSASCASPKKRRNPKLRKIFRDYKRAKARFEKLGMKAAMAPPAPHGYGDGFFECPCARCERSLKLLGMAEEAHAVLQAAKARYAKARARA